MKTKIIVLGLVLALIPAVANARTHTAHSANPFSGYKHQRLKIARKGQILVYNP